MAKGETFWTLEKLADLLARFPTSTPKELMARFDKPMDEIQRAFEFAVADKNLRISRRTIRQKRAGKTRKYLHTVYAPGFARGAGSCHPFEDEEDEDV